MLQLHHLPPSALASRPSVIGAACFGRQPDPLVTCASIPVAQVRVEPLPGEAAVCEAWTAQTPLRQGRSGRVRWSGNDALLFCAVDIHESEMTGTSRGNAGPPGVSPPHAADVPSSAPPSEAPPLQIAARQAYDELFETLDALGYPHLLRVWNHVPDINGMTGGLERYRLFNIGRQDAFLAHGRTVEGASVPAASALGAAGDAPLLVYGIAARRPAKAIENPRQVSAYHYPQDYGPRSPTFSRASLVDFGEQRLLFISGTASIVGHRTLHAEDAAEQTRETLRNIDAVLQQAQDKGAAGMRLADLHYKVYVRRAQDWPVIRAELQRAAGTATRAIALQADVCRIDLLVEIEATGLQASDRVSASC